MKYKNVNVLKERRNRLRIAIGSCGECLHVEDLEKDKHRVKHKRVGERKSQCAKRKQICQYFYMSRAKSIY